MKLCLIILFAIYFISVLKNEEILVLNLWLLLDMLVEIQNDKKIAIYLSFQEDIIKSQEEMIYVQDDVINKYKNYYNSTKDFMNSLLNQLKKDNENETRTTS